MRTECSIWGGIQTAWIGRHHPGPVFRAHGHHPGDPMKQLAARMVVRRDLEIRPDNRCRRR